MDDSEIIATTEENGMLLDTLDPSRLAFDVAEDVNSVSPQMSQLPIGQSTALNGSLNGGNEANIVERQASAAPKFAPLPYASSRTGLVYDVRMRFHVEPKPEDDDMHPEDPRRIFEVYNELVQAGLVDDPSASDLKADFLLLRIPIRPAVKDEIRACHSQSSWDFVMDLASTLSFEDRLARLTLYRLGLGKVISGRKSDGLFVSLCQYTQMCAAGCRRCD